MNTRIISFLISLALFLSTENFLSATGVLSSFSDLIQESQAVVVGEVLDQKSFSDNDKIYTAYRVQIKDDIVDSLSTQEITVVVPGGVYGDIGQYYSIAPTIKPSEEALFFLKESHFYDAFEITDFVAGKYDIINYEGTKLIFNESLIDYFSQGIELSKEQQFKQMRENSQFHLETFKKQIQQEWNKK